MAERKPCPVVAAPQPANDSNVLTRSGTHPVATPTTPTAKFRRQHGDLLELARGLVLLLDVEDLARDAAPARRQLAKLVGVLKVHLAMEDEVMYPRLSRHPDPKVKTLARRFEAEMGGLGATLAAYLARWSSASDIEAAPGAFARETTGIVDALAGRIEREDNELYRMVDRIGLDG